MKTMIKNLNKQCYELRLNKKISWVQISKQINLPTGTVWYRAKIYAQKNNKKWPIELEKKSLAEQVYDYRLQGFSWWKISKLIKRPMRLCKMYSKLWAKRNNRSLDPILN